MKAKKVIPVLLAGAMMALTAGCSSTPKDEPAMAKADTSQAEAQKQAAAEKARMEREAKARAMEEAKRKEAEAYQATLDASAARLEQIRVANRLAEIQAANRGGWEQTLNK